MADEVIYGFSRILTLIHSVNC